MALLLHNGNVIDVLAHRVLPRTSISIHDGIITGVLESSRVPPVAGDAVIDCSGKYLMPGLIDVHAHIRGYRRHGRDRGPPSSADAREGSQADRRGMEQRLLGYLYCGVTSIYDAGNDADLIFALRNDERAGEIASPRIFCTGTFVTCSGGHGSTFASCTEVNSMLTDRHRLDAHLARQPDMLKITYDEHNWGVRPLIPILTTDLLAAIIEHAHESMTRVTVHVSSEFRARQAVASGADALAHPVIQSPVTEEFIWRLASAKIPVASTLAIGERNFRLADGPDYLNAPLYSDCLAPGEREHLKTIESNLQRNSRLADWMRVMTPVAQENLSALVSAGGIVATGTDLTLGPDLHREMELLQAGGFSPWEVIAAATVNGARYLGKESALGVIREDFPADVLILEQDPTIGAANVRSIDMVVKAGKIIDRAAIKEKMLNLVDEPGTVNG